LKERWHLVDIWAWDAAARIKSFQLLKRNEELRILPQPEIVLTAIRSPLDSRFTRRRATSLPAATLAE
jgi:hypothetical protein